MYVEYFLRVAHEEHVLVIILVESFLGLVNNCLCDIYHGSLMLLLPWWELNCEEEIDCIPMPICGNVGVCDTKQ